MPDKSARALDTLIKSLPKTKEYAYRKTLVARPPPSSTPASVPTFPGFPPRARTAWAKSSSARGMNDSQFQLNPLVTLAHAYWCRRSESRCGETRQDGDPAGIKAKTLYPPRPAAWPAAIPGRPIRFWRSFSRACSTARASAFCRTRAHAPEHERGRERGWDAGVGLVIDEWLLLEYACCFLPVNQDSWSRRCRRGCSIFRRSWWVRSEWTPACPPHCCLAGGSPGYAVHAVGGDRRGRYGGLWAMVDWTGFTARRGGGADRPVARAGVRRTPLRRSTFRRTAPWCWAFGVC